MPWQPAIVLLAEFIGLRRLGDRCPLPVGRPYLRLQPAQVDG
jgi:hypothetical protein